METYPVYCAGKFIETGRILEVINPYDGKPFASTWLAGTDEFEAAVRSASGALPLLKEIPSYERYRILNQVANGLSEDRIAFAELISRESGKPLRLALAETDRSIQSFRVAAEESRRLPREYMSIDWTEAGEGKEGLVKHFPIGIVAGISPFNFPLNLAVHKIAPAIAAGCPIILKPSSITPLSTLRLARLIAETTLPPGSVSVLPMDRETGNSLVTDPRIRLLSFTGSPEVGWMMKQKSGRKKVLLELGGNAGVIISKGVSLEAAVKKCVAGGFSYSGQVCIHTQRIFVLEELFDAFASAFVEQVNQLRAGDPLDLSTDIAVMIDEANATRVEEWVNEAITQGARILAGGKRSGRYYQPTVITGTQPGMKVCCEEVFGPVVVLEPVPGFKQALDLINDSCFGLQAGVFTDSIEEMNLAFNEIEAGGVIINDVPTFRADHMPYGGIKNSGLGREGIRYAMMEMLEPRLLVKNC